MALPDPTRRRGGALYVPRSQPPRPWFAVLLLIPPLVVGWSLAWNGFKVGQVVGLVVTCLAPGLLFFGYATPLRYWTRLDSNLRRVQLPPRFGDAREVSFDTIEYVSVVKGRRVGDVTVTWFGVKLCSSNAGGWFIFDSLSEMAVRGVARRVAVFMHLPLREEQVEGEIPR
jgi:hypothetical protein